MSKTTDIKILQLLLKATREAMMTWSNVDDDSVDMFSSRLGNDSFEIELIHLQRSDETVCERALARIQSKKIYQTYAIGTEGFDLITTMLSETIFGWKEGSQNAEIELTKLKNRIETKITEQNGG